LPKKGYKQTKEHREKSSKVRKGKSGSFLGQHHTEEAKEKMRQAKLGHPGYYKGKPGTKGMLGKHQTDETKEKIREAKLGHEVSDKTREKMKLNHRGGFKIGHPGYWLGKPHPHPSGIKKHFYNNTWFRSGWEAKYAEYLDKGDIKWEYEPRVFLLEIEGKRVSYTPDFYLPELNLYHEVKRYERNREKGSLRKVQPAREQCEINLTIIDGSILKQLGII